MKASKLKIMAFGILAEKLNSGEIVLENVENTDQLKSSLVKIFPVLKDMNFSISVNRNIIHHNTLLANESEVALLPPFSGG